MRKASQYVILGAGAVVFAYPFLWMLSSSLKPEIEISGLSLLSWNFSLENYEHVLTRTPIVRALLNSIIVSGCATLSVITTGSMVGYALAKLRFAGSSILLGVIFFTMMLPLQITLIPQYILMVKLGLTDTYVALIAPIMMSGLSIILFRQFFLNIPNALLDAARIDGCSELRLLFRVIWPLARPTVLVVAILTFMSSWNEVLWPLMVVRERDLMTMPQLVTIFVIGGGSEAQLGLQLAAATMLAVPVIVAYAIFQRHFIESMTHTGLKG